MARAQTWIKRVLLGLGAVIVLAVAIVVVTVHTDYGRDLIRKQVESRLDDLFIGGASVGKKRLSERHRPDNTSVLL